MVKPLSLTCLGSPCGHRTFPVPRFPSRFCKLMVKAVVGAQAVFMLLGSATQYGMAEVDRKMKTQAIRQCREDSNADRAVKPAGA